MSSLSRAAVAVAVLGVLLVPSAARPCLPAKLVPWRMKAGAVELAFRPAEPGRSALRIIRGTASPAQPLENTLTLERKGTVLWTMPVRDLFASEVLLSEEGPRVAIFDDAGEGESPEVRLLGEDGHERFRWKVQDQLSPSEWAQLPQTSCGRIWRTGASFRGSELVLDVPVHGMVPPMYEQPPGLELRFDVHSGKVSRPAPERPDPAALIAAWRDEADPRGRWKALTALWRRALDEERPHEALATFWLERLKVPAGDRASSDESSLAVSALEVVATDAQLHETLKWSPNEARDLALFELLAQRVPDDAEAFAITALATARAPELLRQRAITYLEERQGPASRSALERAVEDSSPRVRATALQAVSDLTPVIVDRVDRVLAHVGDPDGKVRASATASLLHMLESRAVEDGEKVARAVCDPRWEDTFDRYAASLFVVCGAVAQAQGDAKTAEALYRRAVRRRTTAAHQDRHRGDALLLEAKLQLAFAAAAAGRREEMRRWAHAVADDPDAHHVYVCAPATPEIARFISRTVCQTRQGKPTADWAAREMLKPTHEKRRRR